MLKQSEITDEELARVLGLSKAKVRKMAREGLEYRKEGRRYCFRRQDVRTWLGAADATRET